jgi:WD40 repeat protein
MNTKVDRWISPYLLTVTSLLFLLCLPGFAWGKWYILTAALPNTVYVIDTDTDKIVKTIPLEGRGPIAGVIPNPARPQFAYVITNLNQSVAVVDLDEGKEVLRFDLSNNDELVRSMAIDVNPQGNRLYIHETPLKKDLGSYEILEPRIRVIDLDTNQVAKIFSTPRQIASLSSSQDGKRLYAFTIGGDASVFDPEKGEVIDTIPMANWGVTGMNGVNGLPIWSTYQENDYIASFAAVVSDAITGNTTLGMAYLDLKQTEPELQVVELQPFEVEWPTLQGVMSAKTNKAYFAWDKLWKVDIETRKVEKVVPFKTSTHFATFLHPEETKVYCGANWNSISVFDAGTLNPITKIELGHSQAGVGLRFVQRERDF